MYLSQVRGDRSVGQITGEGVNMTTGRKQTWELWKEDTSENEIDGVDR